MNRTIMFLLISFIGVSCNNKKELDFLTVLVDVEQDNALLLSEIVDDLQTVELELTEKSIIGNLTQQERVFVFDDYIILLDGHKNQILLFDSYGKFISSIGSKGSGPGEFTQISDITADILNKRIYVATDSKLLTYDFEGNFLREVPCLGFSKYLNYIDNQLMLITTVVGQEDNGGKYFNEAIVYKYNNEGRIEDSIGIYKNYFDKMLGIASTNKNYMTVSGEHTYLYYPVFMLDPVLRDTLYQLNKNQLHPHLRIVFSDGKTENRFIHKLYRSTRYVFSHYHNSDQMEGFVNYYSCYDTKTNKSYHQRNGYIDDLYTGERVRIRPLDMDTERFYYFHTNLNNERLGDEANPTLYIGVLKK
ncbi:6-bladed beta-propeller [Parabacteroides sp. PF5-9]|uniref:6-bladed beta-propeller n=1 Tax=Parabacteroides sp. PF5-9 TaxID=1742404 RepID=UPI0024733BA3|nr:6-bladed beta-propeller [Parabacteroides sp. PF5-9]MDH6359003.1 hypothetical protein [Parabacteroides sp. PF5-9]